MHQVVVIPEWLKLIKHDLAIINSKDVANLFGFSSASALRSSWRESGGSFPPPDSIRDFGLNEFTKKAFWKKSTIMKEIKRRNK